MLTTGNQLRAARALAGLDQGTLAKLAGVNINTISAMEKKGADQLTSGLDKITSVMTVLQDEGVEFLNHGNPGVRLVNQLSPIFRGLTFHEVMSMEWSPWQPCDSDGQAVVMIRRTWNDIPAQGSDLAGVCYADVNATLPVAEWRYVGGGSSRPWQYRHRVPA